MGRNAGSLKTGYLADLVVLDPDHPALVGNNSSNVLDGYLFSGNSSPVRDVMIFGKWIVKDREVKGENALTDRYRKTVRRLTDTV